MARNKQSRAKPAGQSAAPAEARATDAPHEAPGWSWQARTIVTVLLLLHLSAVVLAALTKVDQGGGPFWQMVSTPFRPYIEAADLDHGYRFFAPDPGPSHLLQYQLTMPDGSKRDGIFPNLKDQPQRLLYHRYFMLSEHLAGDYEFRVMQGSILTPDAPEFKQSANAAPSVAALRASSGRNSMLLQIDDVLHTLIQSYADELLRETGAVRVKLELVIHEMPSPDAFKAGQRLDDESLYQAIDLGTFPETPAQGGRVHP